MKKFFTAALLSFTVAFSSFAAPANGSEFARKNFEAQFTGASDVQWTSAKGYTKATFSLNNTRTEALFTTDGDFIGTNHAVTLDDLPVNAKRAFAKKYAGYTVKQAVRFEGIDESAYYVAAENEEGSVVLKVNDNGFMTTVRQ